MYEVDLHTHTRFFHGFPGRPTPYDPVGARLHALVARRRGLDGVAATNHDYCWYDETVDVTPIPGIEVSTTRGHVLVVGPDPPEVTAQGQLTPEETVALAHRRDCAAIMAHPYRNGTLPGSGADFDAVEINGKHLENHEDVRALATQRDLPMVAGSDAHYPVEVGRAFTRVYADELTPESVVEAIRESRVEPVVKETALDRVVRPLYARIHRWKGWMPPQELEGDPRVDVETTEAKRER
ncbi:PHP domain-containing protein [Halomicrobium salinisoli]|uniref:PHP domain-containing protein n=1 Tax=Halomicrobium salinisoli TaxID=2878391 RepID=UPI001CF05E8E|nr:PHP-associated domain-containing protein [Halomicrobium salinisoli]